MKFIMRKEDMKDIFILKSIFDIIYRLLFCLVGKRFPNGRRSWTDKEHSPERGII